MSVGRSQQLSGRRTDGVAYEVAQNVIPLRSRSSLNIPIHRRAPQ
jgi:hypothetical protein